MSAGAPGWAKRPAKPAPPPPARPRERPELGPLPRPSREPGEPEGPALCRWLAADREDREPTAPYRRRQDRCRVLRERPAGHPAGEPVLDCGAPGCAARSAEYRAELARSLPPRGPAASRQAQAP